MLDDAASKLSIPLDPRDLAFLQGIHRAVCDARGIVPSSIKAEESAKVLLSLFQSGIRNKFQLIAMMTGRKFP